MGNPVQGHQNWWCYRNTNFFHFSIDVPLIVPPIFWLVKYLQDYSSNTNFSYLPAPLFQASFGHFSKTKLFQKCSEPKRAEPGLGYITT